MKWLAWLSKTRVKDTNRRPRTFRPGLETLEDRLTPSTLQAVDFVANRVAAPQVATEATSFTFAAPMAVQTSGGYVTGTTGSATAEAVAVGADGSTYVAGLVNDPTVSTDQLAYVKKYDPTGAPVYQTDWAYFSTPGSATEFTGIAVDSLGNTYLSGKAHDAGAGTDNGILLAVDPTGATAVYAFFQPGGGPVNTKGVALDTAGDAVFVGQYSTTATDHFLLAERLTSSGTSTYAFFYSYGVTGESGQLNADAMPASGTSTTVVGWVNVPGTTTANNGFAMNLDATGAPTVAAILVDPTTDSANAVALDTTGNVYIAGTLDIGGPTQSAAVLKVDPTLSTVIWAFAPAATATQGNGIALNAAGDVIVTGADSSGKAYISKMHGSDGMSLDYTTFGGTGGSDVGNAVAIRTSDGTVFDVGTTNSSDFPATDGSTLNGTKDGFLTGWTI